MAHFTLIRLPHVVTAASYAAVREPPLGVAYIAGAIESAGNRVTVIDGVGEAPDTRTPAAYPGLVTYGLTIKEVVDRIPQDTDGIGLSVMFSIAWPHAEALVRAIGARFPGVPLIVGGEHVTATWKYVLRTSPEVTVCVLGEGELAAIELNEWLDKKRTLESISGIAIRDADGEPVKTEKRPRVREPGTLPWPAWHLIPMKNYLSRGLCGTGVHRGLSIPILGTRGCPFQCTFCSSPNMWTTRYVVRPVKDVVDEIESYVERFNISNVDFEDLTAFIKKEWILALCKELQERKLGITFQLPIGTRSETLDREVLEAIYKTGCTNIGYAPESGSPTTLKRIKKKVNLDKMMESIKIASEIGLVIKVNMMIGFPGETRRDMLETVLFCMKLAQIGVRDLQIYPFCPYPGTELYDELYAKGVLPELSNDYFASLTFSEWGQRTRVNEHVYQQEIGVYQVSGMLLTQAAGYATHPERILKTIHNVRAGKFESLGERALVRMMNGGDKAIPQRFGFRPQPIGADALVPSSDMLSRAARLATRVRNRATGSGDRPAP